MGCGKELAIQPTLYTIYTRETQPEKNPAKKKNVQQIEKSGSKFGIFWEKWVEKERFFGYFIAKKAYFLVKLTRKYGNTAI